MTSRTRLFLTHDLYDLPGTDALFLEAMRESVTYHTARCPEFCRLLKHRDFTVSMLRTISDLEKIPMLPTLFLKSHNLFSVPQERLLFKATSSGTKGRLSTVGLDFSTAWLSLPMVLKTFSFHGLLSLNPTNYIILGYEPAKRNRMGAAQTAFGLTFLAPAAHRAYALRDTGEAYKVDLTGLIDALKRYAHRGLPVRFYGFPAYLLFLLDALEERNLSFRLHPQSMVMTGGGWKQFFFQKADRNDLYQRAARILGIPEENCHDFYGAVEHPIPYCDCSNHHFHIPKYSRVLIRDVRTLAPLPFGQPGLINLITPLMRGMPLLSVMTDDLAVLHPGARCGCGIASPWFEILGRVGLKNVKTCAAVTPEMAQSFTEGGFF